MYACASLYFYYLPGTRTTILTSLFHWSMWHYTKGLGYSNEITCANWLLVNPFKCYYCFLFHQVPQFGPLFDGAIVDHVSLPVLVRTTAINALRARRDIHMAYRGRYKISSPITMYLCIQWCGIMKLPYDVIYIAIFILQGKSFCITLHVVRGLLRRNRTVRVRHCVWARVKVWSMCSERCDNLCNPRWAIDRALPTCNSTKCNLVK